MQFEELLFEKDRFWLKRRRWLLKRHPYMFMGRLNRIAAGKPVGPGMRPRRKAWIRRESVRIRQAKRMGIADANKL